jgi:hypothetical protein
MRAVSLPFTVSDPAASSEIQIGLRSSIILRFFGFARGRLVPCLWGAAVGSEFTHAAEDEGERLRVIRLNASPGIPPSRPLPRRAQELFHERVVLSFEILDADLARIESSIPSHPLRPI